jgi:hypothetical protein
LINRVSVAAGFHFERQEDLTVGGTATTGEAGVIEAPDGFGNGKIFVFVLHRSREDNEESLTERLDRVRRIREEEISREREWEAQRHREHEEWRRRELQREHPFQPPPPRGDLSRPHARLVPRDSCDAAVGFRQYWDSQRRHGEVEYTR